MTAMEPAESDLWSRYRCNGDADARDQLFSRYVPWAAAIARSVHMRVRAYQVDREDFIQNANIGLLDAMSRYEPERGIAFHLYAKTRVRGAVFNGLKTILGDRPIPKDSHFAERLESMRGEDGTTVFDEVIGSIVGLSIGYMLDESVRSLVQEPHDASVFAEKSQIESRVLDAIGRLPERLQAIVRSHYFDHIPFQQIAAEMGVTKGRVSQLHHAALARMREELRES